ncbi:Bcr/CflA family efflux MFS transporter [Inconstantimicrobium mannanitabidum]|uniref:Bcr/CflA family drug resistance efflux transporter n=1 Tax=Inconstantimicrobium mannanitabidum TaxID=1604901 RepID=A0ACB5RFV6_9CLOT|nr:Bcr/CflA family efflux MFS transporter [Clostridium sp. TW13]GKX67981.1 Bcr/CflA family drug resistance efflux transporter [Clostridium sp. TW13]
MKIQNSILPKRNIYFLVVIVPFLMGLGVDLYVPSLPMVTSYFHTSANLVQLTISLYLLGYGIGQVVLGVLSDSFGRKKILILCALSFSLISFASILSSNIFIFQTFRFLQGICVAGLAVVVRAVLVDVFSGIELRKATTYFTLSWSLGPILAPFIGSNLEKCFGWKSNFYVFCIYGLFIFIYSLIRFKETNLNLTQFNITKTYSTLSSIITHPTFMLISTISALGYGAIVLFNAVGPFLIEVLLKYSVVEYGTFALILGFAYFFGTISNSIAIKFFNSNILLHFGLIASLSGSIFMLLLGILLHINLYIILIPVFIIFFFIGFIVPNALALTMSLFSNSAGSASAIFGTITGIVVFIVISLGSNLKTNSQIPLTFIYMFIFVVSTILFVLSKKIKNK